MRVLSSLLCCIVVPFLTFLAPADANVISGFARVMEEEGQVAMKYALESSLLAMRYASMETRLSNPTFQVTTDPGASCPSNGEADIAARFLALSLAELSQRMMLPLGSVIAKSQTSAAIADAVAEIFSLPFVEALSAGASISNFQGGAGAGFGFQVYCSGTNDVVLSFGGGGGGGLTGQDHDSFSGGMGGGGGVQSVSDSVSAGGGTGCSFDHHGLHDCHPTPDARGLNFFTVVRAGLEHSHCRSMVVKGGGGGGGGFSYNHGGACHYGGGFGFEFEGVVVLVEERLAAENSTVAEKGLRAFSLNSTEAAAMPELRAENSNPSGDAAKLCSSQCGGHSDFYRSCFCPCFKDRIIAANLSWGKTISCV